MKATYGCGKWIIEGTSEEVMEELLRLYTFAINQGLEQKFQRQTPCSDCKYLRRCHEGRYCASVYGGCGKIGIKELTEKKGE